MTAISRALLLLTFTCFAFTSINAGKAPVTPFPRALRLDEIRETKSLHKIIRPL